MRRNLLVLLLGFAIAALAYHATRGFLGDRDLGPTRCRSVPPAWPPPPAAPPHALWPQLPDLASRDPDRRAAALTKLLALDPGRLPHPAYRPGAWPDALRLRVRALLWRLYRGHPYRVAGWQLILRRPAGGALRTGEAAGLRLETESSGTTRRRFPPDLAELTRAGARLHVVSRGGALHVPHLLPEPPRPSPPGTGRGRDGAPLRHPDLEAAWFTEPGQYRVVVALDLTDVKRAGLPRGILVSNTLSVTVQAAD